MADKTTPTGSGASDTAELERQLAALRDDFAGVVSLLRTMAEDRASGAAAQARASKDALAEEAARYGRDARDAVDTTVRNNPFTSLGAAMALGFALGALTRR